MLSKSKSVTRDCYYVLGSPILIASSKDSGKTFIARENITTQEIKLTFPVSKSQKNPIQLFKTDEDAFLYHHLGNPSYINNTIQRPVIFEVKLSKQARLYPSFCLVNKNDKEQVCFSTFSVDASEVELCRGIIKTYCNDGQIKNFMTVPFDNIQPHADISATIRLK